jgi:protein-tyrosine phosphatase
MDKIVDIHMHVVPGIDDGAKSMEESFALLRQSAAQGVGTIVVTPHSWAIDQRGIGYTVSRFEELKHAVLEAKIPVELCLGCEMLVYPDTVDECIQKLQDGRYPTLAGSSCVLTEFEPYFYQHEMEICVEKISAAGFVPVISHAERYNNATVSGTKELKALGAMVQINFYSIVNESKAHTRETANALLTEKLVDFIGSDAHRLDHRPPVICNGIEALEERYSKEYARKVAVENPLNILGVPEC